MAKFMGLLDAKEIGESSGRTVHKLDTELVWEHGLVRITVPVGFETDLASVPRLPIAYWLWGDRAHREGVLHDYLYRIDASPALQKEDCDWYFREAMIGQDNSWFVYHPMWLAVRCAGGSSFHRMNVMDRFPLDKVY